MVDVPTHVGLILRVMGLALCSMIISMVFHCLASRCCVTQPQQVFTGPVLMIVDSSTLTKEGAHSKWRRVVASFMYFGVLGVILFEALMQSPSSEVHPPLTVWH